MLDKRGWKGFRPYVCNDNSYMANMTKLRTSKRPSKFMYGYQVPDNYQQDILIDKYNGNNEWKEYIDLEMKQIMEYDTFHSIGKHTHPPDGYKNICVHLVFTIKHDGRHKARLVADGHLTDLPIHDTYSGVVSLCGLRIVILISELNNLSLVSTDIGNAYLEADTEEKVCVVGGPEFGIYQGHTLIIQKALYGMRSSGLRWNEIFSDSLRTLNFSPSYAEPDIWIRDGGNTYEYVTVYVDDIVIAARNPMKVIHELQDTHRFQLKGKRIRCYV